MVITNDVKLPTNEELTTTEIHLSGAALRAGAFHLGKHCENENNVRRGPYFVYPYGCIILKSITI